MATDGVCRHGGLHCLQQARGLPSALHTSWTLRRHPEVQPGPVDTHSSAFDSHRVCGRTSQGCAMSRPSHHASNSSPYCVTLVSAQNTWVESYLGVESSEGTFGCASHRWRVPPANVMCLLWLFCSPMTPVMRVTRPMQRWTNSSMQPELKIPSSLTRNTTLETHAKQLTFQTLVVCAKEPCICTWQRKELQTSDEAANLAAGIIFVDQRDTILASKFSMSERPRTSLKLHNS